ncbi:AAA family ATPase [Nocardiopsis gilva YIM 90087]|uniref:DNA 3'-5' helicase n=1 Tax=Nocardiopsis gilva YIM 90087 TaxID=1235441 RepID=A0A223S2T6_9ACTN|nr:UvrD-helicase domain-containing protein [Nocardiopsis gilva]ASU82446.1 AAA family ATPase [Nocardiopsis gilva YIM 90087]
MRFHADLHIHSKYSRACSKDADLEHLTWWARRKGIAVVGTGDFTHPAWFAHLRESLVPAEPGLFRLRDDLDRDIVRKLPPNMAAAPVRFMLSVEISTIYKRGERTRKIHHLIYMPDFEAAAEFNRRLGRIGNLGSDGRPIIGLDSRDLLEITLESGAGSYLVPAHVWTPWFAVLGSKAGFDAIEDCYLDLSDHIFALETGLSSDPAMNWRISGLDRYRLVSNSDAHSPPMLGRETTVLDTELDYFAIRRALETGAGHEGSVEFFPEEGKYHVDGHRKCEVRMEPRETRERGTACPVCGKPVTVGVLSRVEELADRPAGARPEGAADFRSLVPLPEVMGEILSVGPKSKKVRGEIDTLTAALGPELAILETVPTDDIERHSPLLAEAVGRLRRGEVIREAGYDGEYGVIRLFEPDELKRASTAAVPSLFDDLPFDTGGAAPEPQSTRREPAAEPPSDAASEGKARSGPTAPSDEGKAGDAAPEAPATERGSASSGAAESPAPGPERSDGATPPDAGAANGDQPPREAPEPPDHPGASLLDGLDPDQRAAAEVTDGPVLIIAGPGTGKTRTVTHRLAHLVAERGVDPEHCLAITFTRRAAEEMAERLTALAPEHAPRLTIATFHSLGLRMLRELHDRAGLTSSFGIADQARQLELATEAAGDEKTARRLLGARSRRRGADEGMPPELADATDRYTKALRQRDLVDFDDLIALPVELLESDAELAAAYRDRFRWISVDEYQDVDDRQYRLLRLLAPADGNLTAIGDPDQAIYRFRGADVGFFLRFREDFPSARAVQLTRNYRSSANILTASLQAISPTTLVPERELRPMGDHGDADTDAARVGVHSAANERAEASSVARTIELLLGGASFHSFDSGRITTDETHGLGFSDFAVLYRTDRQANAVMEGLTRAGLPFQKRSHDRITDRPGVRPILAELAFAPTAGAASVVASVTERLLRAADTVIERIPHAEREEAAVDIHTAVDLLKPRAEECGADMARFRDELALGVEVDTWDPRADRVSLLTLHAAKGLEFPVVFVVGCEDGLLPLRWPGAAPGEDDEEEVREERRLLFVGMTRAQRHLFLSHAAERARQGSTRPSARSPFLADVDTSVCESVGEAAARRKQRDTQLRLL